MNPTGKITPHFAWSEALCKDGCEMPADIQVHVRAMARVMEAVRQALSDKPIIVNSWYRCWARHAAIYAPKPAPKGSLHLLGLGVDFAVPGMTPAEVFKVCQTLQEQGIVGGIELAPGHTHVDCGPTRTFEGPSL